LVVSRFPVDRAVLCDLVENDQRPLLLRDGILEVAVPGFGFATVRLHSTAVPPSLGGVVVESSTDDRVRLHWPAVPGVASYNVFRSVDPDEPPTAHSFVGRTTEAAFTDTGLNLDTTYTYFVAAVAPGNSQGPVSVKMDARTSARNVAPPSPVRELGIVRQAADRLMVCWRKAPESDVARYFVYRSERPDFSPTQLQAIAEVKPGGYYLEHFMDGQLSAGTTYYYQVVAEDWASNRQLHSPLAAGTTPRISP